MEGGCGLGSCDKGWDSGEDAIETIGSALEGGWSG